MLRKMRWWSPELGIWKKNGSSAFDHSTSSGMLLGCTLILQFWKSTRERAREEPPSPTMLSRVSETPYRW